MILKRSDHQNRRATARHRIAAIHHVTGAFGMIPVMTRTPKNHRLNATVLIKSAYPWVDAISDANSLAQMQLNNPDASGNLRPAERLCAGQTLLCRALGLKVPDWDAQRFDAERLYVEDCGITVPKVIQAARLGIPHGRDEHLPYRFVDAEFARFCTRNPLRRGQVEGRDFSIIERPLTQEGS
ncbi:DNA-3-methyladenine glycosylase [Pseudomonas putida]